MHFAQMCLIHTVQRRMLLSSTRSYIVVGGRSYSKTTFQSAVDRSVVTRTAIAVDELREMVTEELEGKDEMAPEAKKKKTKKTVENTDIEDRGYVLKESSAKDAMLLKEPGFRMGNIRAAIIEMHANYRGCSIKDEIHRVLVNIMIQVWYHNKFDELKKKQENTDSAPRLHDQIHYC